jgi:hydroxymethylglutaryl-CoA reductase
MTFWEAPVQPSSRISGFYQLSPAERARRVAEFAGLDEPELALLQSESGLGLDQADRMIENVVGVYGLPLAIATNFVVNGRDVLAPMVVEEPSVVAGLSYAARLVREGGGFTAIADPPEMIGQMQVLDAPDPAAARLRLLAAQAALLAVANECDPVLVNLGGGARALEARVLDSSLGPMLIVHLVMDVCDAMGANAANTAVEALAPHVERITGGRVALRIISNLADRRLARAWGVVPKQSLAMEGLTADEGVSRVLEAHAFAVADPYRAATHNKGIMNGIDAVALATGNDWRAIEAGAHAYAARTGRYLPLTAWERNANGDLVGSIELPMAAGIFGGATRVHPKARLGIKIMGTRTARQLAEVMAAVGLGQNLAALRALAMEGIQRGHMRLHARQVAMSAGATGAEIDAVVAAMVSEGVVRSDRAEAILQQLRSEGRPCA